MMYFAIAGFVFLILIGYCSFFSYCHMDDSSSFCMMVGLPMCFGRSPHIMLWSGIGLRSIFCRPQGAADLLTGVTFVPAGSCQLLIDIYRVISYNYGVYAKIHLFYERNVTVYGSPDPKSGRHACVCGACFCRSFRRVRTLLFLIDEVSHEQ